MDQEKRQLRQLKRALKRAGQKHRRNALKRQLAKDPEATIDHTESFGGYRSHWLNGIDHDATRKRSTNRQGGDAAPTSDPD